MTKRLGNWVSTGLLALWLVPSDVLDLSRVPGVLRATPLLILEYAAGNLRPAPRPVPG